MAPYLTADEVKEARPDVAQIDDEVIERRIRQFELIIERARGVAYTPRVRTVTPRQWRYSSWFRLPNIKVRTVDDVLIDGDPVALPDLVRIVPDRLGDLVDLTDASFTATTPPFVTYTHGLDGPDDIALEACLEYVERTITADRSGTSRDIIAQSYEGGFTRYATPDWDAGRWTGWLEVDRLISSLEDYRPVGLG